MPKCGKQSERKVAAAENEGWRMSGGHFKYTQRSLTECLNLVTQDEEVLERFPYLAKALTNLNKELTQILHDLDYDLSRDEDVENDGFFESEAIRSLHFATIVYGEEVIKDEDM